MTNVIDLNSRRAETAEAMHSRDAADTLAHLANTADAMRELLRACSKEATAGALTAARMALATAVVTMLGPDWELARYGDN